MADTNLFLSKSDLAYAELRGRILFGTLPAGSRLAQYDLAESLNMSITPLREAIRRLSSEGLVTVETHRDVRVSTMTSDEARQLFEVRLSLDPTAAELAALRRTDEDIATMRAAVDQLLPVTRQWGKRHSRPTVPSIRRCTGPRTTTCSSVSWTISGTSPTATGASASNFRPATNPAPGTSKSITNSWNSSRTDGLPRPPI